MCTTYGFCLGMTLKMKKPWNFNLIFVCMGDCTYSCVCTCRYNNLCLCICLLSLDINVGMFFWIYHFSRPENSMDYPISIALAEVSDAHGYTLLSHKWWIFECRSSCWHSKHFTPLVTFANLMVFNMDRAIIKRKEATLFKCLNMR